MEATGRAGRTSAAAGRNFGLGRGLGLRRAGPRSPDGAGGAGPDDRPRPAPPGTAARPAAAQPAIATPRPPKPYSGRPLQGDIVPGRTPAGGLHAARRGKDEGHQGARHPRLLGQARLHHAGPGQEGGDHQANAWYRRASYGHQGLTGTATKWLKIPRQTCGALNDDVIKAARKAADKAHYHSANYDRFVLYEPCSTNSGAIGIGNLPGNQVVLMKGGMTLRHRRARTGPQLRPRARQRADLQEGQQPRHLPARHVLPDGRVRRLQLGHVLAVERQVRRRLHRAGEERPRLAVRARQDGQWRRQRHARPRTSRRPGRTR